MSVDKLLDPCEALEQLRLAIVLMPRDVKDALKKRVEHAAESLLFAAFNQGALTQGMSVDAQYEWFTKWMASVEASADRISERKEGEG